MNIIRITAAAAILFSAAFTAAGDGESRHVKDAGLQRSDDRLVVVMDIDIAGMKFSGGAELERYGSILKSPAVILQ